MLPEMGESTVISYIGKVFSAQCSIDVSERSLPSVVADKFLFCYCLFIVYKLISLAEKVGARI